MKAYFDTSKIKTVTLSNLVGRAIVIREFSSEGQIMTIAFDLDTGENFVLAYAVQPVVDLSVEHK